MLSCHSWQAMLRSLADLPQQLPASITPEPNTDGLTEDLYADIPHACIRHLSERHSNHEKEPMATRNLLMHRKWRCE